MISVDHQLIDIYLFSNYLLFIKCMLKKWSINFAKWSY